MSITKKYLKTKPVCKVKFELPKEVAGEATKVNLVGDFNEWDEQSLEMKKAKNGSFSATLDLALDSEYQFRYFIDDTKWENDPAADKYVPNNICSAENSVVEV